MDSVETDLLARNPWVTRRAITVDDYHRMADVGILNEDDRVELIEGNLVAISPMGTEHVGAVNWLTRALVMAVGDLGVVSVQNPVRLSDRTEPQPDLIVLRPRPDHYRKAPAGPEDVLLLIEIADSSLKYDRAVKKPLYARHGIPEFWIVDVGGQEVEVCRTPTDDGYASVVRFGRGETLVSTGLPAVTIPVSALLG